MLAHESGQPRKIRFLEQPVKHPSYPKLYNPFSRFLKVQKVVKKWAKSYGADVFQNAAALEYQLELILIKSLLCDDFFKNVPKLSVQRIR